jgi:hypothetical protein
MQLDWILAVAPMRFSLRRRTFVLHKRRIWLDARPCRKFAIPDTTGRRKMPVYCTDRDPRIAVNTNLLLLTTGLLTKALTFNVRAVTDEATEPYRAPWEDQPI